ncbi:MAG: RnfABCDGE type electron transport complex subunit G [Treponema sp.]|nr:RnfABCDGE type electron transport complex subunit G [Treponema sp.]
MKFIIKPASTLFITAVITVAVLSVVYNLTLEPIENQKRRTQETVMREILPRATEYHEIETEKTGSITAVYEGYFSSDALDDKVLVGYVIQLSPEGYSGKIDLVVGINRGIGKISGMRVLSHTETPGLGALAVKENFYNRYESMPLMPLTVVRNNPGEYEIQAITSATITTRAITNAVNEAIEWYLMNSPGTAETEDEE